MKEVDPSRGVFITAQGILTYFEPGEVRGLIAECASQFAAGRMMFDLIPRWFSENTLSGYQRTRSYTTPRTPCGVDVNETRLSSHFTRIYWRRRKSTMGAGGDFTTGM